MYGWTKARPGEEKRESMAESKISGDSELEGCWAPLDSGDNPHVDPNFDSPVSVWTMTKQFSE